MTEAERMQEFQRLLNDAQQKTGMSLDISLKSRDFGGMVQVEYVMTAVPIANWQAPAASDLYEER